MSKVRIHANIYKHLVNSGVGKHWKGDEKKMIMIKSRIFSSCLGLRKSKLHNGEASVLTISFFVKQIITSGDNDNTRSKKGI